MALTREELYDAVWSQPMEAVAAKHGVSGSFLTRVCETLNVPRPQRGHWAKLKAGKLSPKPLLPPPSPGAPLEWRRDSAPVARASAVAPTLPAGPGEPRGRVQVPQTHPLLSRVQPLFEKSRPGRSFIEGAEYLRPYKKALPDIFVSKELLPRALELANGLYRSLTAGGYRVVFGPEDGHHYTRPFLAYAGKQREDWQNTPWEPSVPTVVFIGSVAIGLTVYEPAEEAEARYIDGKYVRVSELPAPRRRNPNQWTSKHMFPSRRLAIRAYSPYVGTSWEKTWTESSPGGRGIDLKRLRKELVKAASAIASMAVDAERRRQEETTRLEAEQRRWRIKEARRLYSEALATSRADLMSTVEAWSVARRVEQFFEDIERRTADLGTDEKEALAARISLARELLGGTDALQRLRKWRAPAERLGHEDIELLKTEGGGPDGKL
ncbi:MAG: hypothetical protein QM767_11315 [Anaeromyxobacter sp.]